MDIAKYELAVEQLRWQCNPAIFDFASTGELAPLREFIGQDRAIRAIEFGLSMDHDGYNIYLAGLTGTGKTSAVKTHIDNLLEEKRALKQVNHPQDWCYLYNFLASDCPQIVSLSQGKGKVFSQQVHDLLQKLKGELAKAFSSEEYKAERKKNVEEAKDEQRKLSEKLREEAWHEGFALQMTPMGPVLVPLSNAKPMSQDDYAALDESVKQEIEARSSELLRKVESTYEIAKELEGKMTEKLRGIDKAVAEFTVSKLFDSLIQEYETFEKVCRYLIDLKSYTLDNLDIFKEKEEQKGPVFLGVPASYIMRGRDPFLPFYVNVFVDNSNTSGPPIIIEPNPNYANLFGKIERQFLFGGYLSDHTMLKPGAFHLANGGYLLLNATDVLMNPGVWTTLKRTVKTKEARIEEPFEQLGLAMSHGLKPHPMPINVKVLLIGDSILYQILSMYDEDFWEIFKVKADFNYEIDKTEANMKHFAAFVSSCCEKSNLRHFDRTGVAKVVEYASRMVADQEKLSARFAQIRELVQEAEYWASKDQASLVSGKHVDRAFDEKFFRHNLPDEHINEMIQHGTILIDVGGSAIGQVNGLSLYALGDVIFGKPSRITCKTFLGRGGVINIEREAQLSGRIHNKGFLILGGYMGWKYAQDNPLSLSASICFEQSYEGVEGDSASSAELYALLSSLSGIPIKQGIAVTGSVNQKGEIQPIGGVNQKIEGFFNVCRAKGLNGNQGVMIPRQNQTNLMLRQEVLDAAREGKFHVYATSTIDEGIEVLTGAKAGKRKGDGSYPKGSVNYNVDKQLKEMAARLKQFYWSTDKEKKEEVA